MKFLIAFFSLVLILGCSSGKENPQHQKPDSKDVPEGSVGSAPSTPSSPASPAPVLPSGFFPILDPNYNGIPGIDYKDAVVFKNRAYFVSSAGLMSLDALDLKAPPVWLNFMTGAPFQRPVQAHVYGDTLYVLSREGFFSSTDGVHFQTLVPKNEDLRFKIYKYKNFLMTNNKICFYDGGTLNCYPNNPLNIRKNLATTDQVGQGPSRLGLNSKGEIVGVAYDYIFSVGDGTKFPILKTFLWPSAERNTCEFEDSGFWTNAVGDTLISYIGRIFFTHTGLEDLKPISAATPFKCLVKVVAMDNAKIKVLAADTDYQAPYTKYFFVNYDLKKAKWEQPELLTMGVPQTAFNKMLTLPNNQILLYGPRISVLNQNTIQPLGDAPMDPEIKINAAHVGVKCDDSRNCYQATPNLSALSLLPNVSSVLKSKMRGCGEAFPAKDAFVIFCESVDRKYVSVAFRNDGIISIIEPNSNSRKMFGEYLYDDTSGKIRKINLFDGSEQVFTGPVVAGSLLRVLSENILLYENNSWVQLSNGSAIRHLEKQNVSIHSNGNVVVTVEGSGSWPPDIKNFGTWYDLKTGQKETFIPDFEGHLDDIGFFMANGDFILTRKVYIWDAVFYRVRGGKIENLCTNTALSHLCGNIEINNIFSIGDYIYVKANYGDTYERILWK